MTLQKKYGPHCWDAALVQGDILASPTSANRGQIWGTVEIISDFRF